MRKLSKAERFVLTKIEEDCRQPASRIAKEGRLSPEGVIKIIKRLEQNDIVKEYKTKCNYSKLGITIYRSYIKLKKKNAATIEKIKKILGRHKCCPWHSFCEGEFDLRISIEINSAKGLGNMERLFVELDKYIAEKQMMIFLSAFSLSKTFIEKTRRKLFTVIGYNDNSSDLTDNETKLLKLLRSSPTIKITEASEKLGISLKTASKILKGLIKRQIITGFKSKINMANLGYLPYIALFALDRYDSLDLEKLQAYCKNLSSVDYFIRGIGNYNIEVVMFAKTTNQFYETVNEIREKFPFIKKISTLIESY